MSNTFFQPRLETNPTIYGYEHEDVLSHVGWIKVGYSGKGVAQRVLKQHQTAAIDYKIVFEASAMRQDGSAFSDRDLHRYLRKKGVENPIGEWFVCDLRTLEAAYLAIKNGIANEDNRTISFGMRPEQTAAVDKAVYYFESYKKDNPNKIPHFLWNAKMRFGKTFTSYQLAKKMKWQRLLVLTFKPAVQSAWKEDLNSHLDFEGWQFISNKADDLSYEQADKTKPFVCFASFQDFLGKNAAGGIKPKNEWAHSIDWDCVIFDEYHYGAWRDNAKDLFEAESDREAKFAEGEGIENFDVDLIAIKTKHYLYLSGTPFRAISSGEFIEEQIFNWTYSDEQRAKENWADGDNPYASLPRMVMLTYQLPDAIREIAMKGEFNEFDLNVFFAAEGEGINARFKYASEVQKWLDLIRGSYLETSIDNLKMGAEKPPMPYGDVRLLHLLTHTFWFLPTVSSCYAMRSILAERANTFYHSYKIVVAAGTEAGIGVDAMKPVLKAMENPLQCKTITLSCGKLTTGVSIKPWTGIFMLRNSSSPETYFQAAFRVQTPWTIKNPDSQSPNKEDILKQECYVFDFAPDRALRQIADYSCRLNVGESNPEQKVAEFVHFLPVLAYDGSSMKQIDAAGILDMAMSGTTATLLARRWESALLVNVDNNTLQRLMNNEDAMKALMNIEGFRTLNQDIETIINKSEAVKKAKKEASEEEGGFSATKKKELSEEEKEFKTLRKQIQDKLIKFATRIPVFMYLTDYREHSLVEVITQLEPDLFRKVTGLTLKDFSLLVSIGVFNEGLMNDAVYKFKRYEDASLEYTGVNRHFDETRVGGFNTVITTEEFRVQ